MTSVYRVRAVWAGFTGAPGYTNFHFTDAGTDAQRNAAGTAVHNWFAGINTFLKQTWSIQVQSEVAEYNVESGELVGAAAMTTVPATVYGMDSTSSWAGGTGFSVQWTTGMIADGRRIHGRTFVVPALGCFEADGTLTGACITAVGSANQALINASGAEFAIWKRVWTKPTLEMTGAQIKAFKQEQIDGKLAIVTGAFVKDTASQLRTRRT